MIKIKVDQVMDIFSISKALAHIFMDQGVAGQLGQRVLIARQGQILFIDELEQGIGAQYADILHIFHHDQAFIVVVAGIGFNKVFHG